MSMRNVCVCVCVLAPEKILFDTTECEEGKKEQGGKREKIVGILMRKN